MQATEWTQAADKREALIPDGSDNGMVASLVEWIAQAKRAEVKKAAWEDASSESWPRPPATAVVHLRDGTEFALAPACERSSAESSGDCGNPEGRVNVWEGTGDEPATQLISPDLAGWLEEGYRYTTDAVISDANPRAIGDNGNKGEFVLVPKSKERYRQFETPSCMNAIGDYRIAGDYEVAYNPGTGASWQTVEFLPGFEFIQPGEDTIKLQRLDFGSFAAFALIPKYKDCHGLEFRLYGYANGEAYRFTFIVEDRENATFSVDPVKVKESLRVVKGQLVVDGGYAAGMDNRIRYTFKPDAKSHTMKLVKEEPIPVE